MFETFCLEWYRRCFSLTGDWPFLKLHKIQPTVLQDPRPSCLLEFTSSSSKFMSDIEANEFYTGFGLAIMYAMHYTTKSKVLFSFEWHEVCFRLSFLEVPPHSAVPASDQARSFGASQESRGKVSGNFFIGCCAPIAQSG